MVRVLRILAIVVFAAVLTFSANALFRMYKSGELYEAYNSERKAKLTLFVFSLVSFVSLCGYEYLQLRKPPQNQGFGGRFYWQKNEVEEDVSASSGIYSSGSRSGWKDHAAKHAKARHRHNHRHHHHLRTAMVDVWVNVLKFMSVLLPPLYLSAAVVLLRNGIDHFFMTELFFFTSIFLSCLSLFFVACVFGRRGVGLPIGYVLAVINLLIFPAGTVIGLFLIVGLTGAAPMFTAARVKKHRAHVAS